MILVLSFYLVCLKFLSQKHSHNVIIIIIINEIWKCQTKICSSYMAIIRFYKEKRPRWWKTSNFFQSLFFQFLFWFIPIPKCRENYNQWKNWRNLTSRASYGQKKVKVNFLSKLRLARALYMKEFSVVKSENK